MPRDEDLALIDMSQAPPPKSNGPDYEELQGPMFEGGLTQEIEPNKEPEMLEVFSGFPLPVVQDYGATEQAAPQGEATPQGESATHIMPDWYQKAVSRHKHSRKDRQREEREKRAHGFQIGGPFTVPLQNNTPVQVLGRNTARRTAIIYNTGTVTTYIGASENLALSAEGVVVGGFPLLGGAALSIDNQGAHWAYIPGTGTDESTLATATTISIYEEMYEDERTE